MRHMAVASILMVLGVMAITGCNWNGPEAPGQVISMAEVSRPARAILERLTAGG